MMLFKKKVVLKWNPIVQQWLCGQWVFSCREGTAAVCKGKLPDRPLARGDTLTITASPRPMPGARLLTIKEGCVLGLDDDPVNIELPLWACHMLGVSSHSETRIYERWITIEHSCTGHAPAEKDA